MRGSLVTTICVRLCGALLPTAVDAVSADFGNELLTGLHTHANIIFVFGRYPHIHIIVKNKTLSTLFPSAWEKVRIY